MERIMKAQALSDISTIGYMAAKKHMKINPEHAIIKEPQTESRSWQEWQVSQGPCYALFWDWFVELNLEDPQVHAVRIHRMIKLGLGIDEQDDDEEEEEDGGGSVINLAPHENVNSLKMPL